MRLLLPNLDPADHPESARSLGQLEVICSKQDLRVVPVDDLAATTVGDFDALLLAGGFRPSNEPQPGWYRPLVELVQGSGKPVLGIGLGFELVCAAYGASLVELGELAAGAPVMVPTEDGTRLFQGTDPLRVAEAVRWLVAAEDLPKVLQVLAASETGIEAVKHRTLPAYGVQLYPEDFTYPSDGKLVYENLLSALQKAAPALPAVQPA